MSRILLGFLVAGLYGLPEIGVIPHAVAVAADVDDMAVMHEPVDQVDTALVLRCLEPIWTTKTETASRLCLLWKSASSRSNSVENGT